MALRTIIVEDEPLSRIFLKSLLTAFCPTLEVVDTVSTEKEAVESINRLKPDLVFMDIGLQSGSGFTVLRHTHQHPYHVIFTTALDESGVRCIRMSGVDYLQKPIDIERLQLLIGTLNKPGKISASGVAVKYLLETLTNDNRPQHLLIHTSAGQEYLALGDIIAVRAAGDDCIFITTQKEITGTGSNIKEMEKLLCDSHFFRLHTDYLVHTGKLKSAPKPSAESVTMLNNATIPVSPKKIAQLIALVAMN